jgi:hypothetical protein
MDVLARLSGEHERLGEHLERIAAAAEARDDGALAEALRTAGMALAGELDAHMALEEAEAFAAIEGELGEGLVAPFRADHLAIRALRDAVLDAARRDRAPHDAALRLCDLIVDHQQREDLVLFPVAHDILRAR